MATVKKPPPPVEERVLSDTTIECVCQAIKEGKCQNIVVMTGAGLSCAAGIPDFRTPGTGLYSNLQKYNLPYPESIFTLDFFRDKPEPFFTLAKELYPGNYKPTPAHYFIRLLHEKGLLLRNYTQNVDTLERLAGVPEEKLIEAHGSFANAHCLGCRRSFSPDMIKEAIFNDTVPRCSCGDLIKPDIVFFGESLPKTFFTAQLDDFPICDLLLVIGTSLKVQPFAGLINKVLSTTPRVLINMDIVGNFEEDPNYNYRDVMVLGDLQESIFKIVEILGWQEEFKELLERNK
eukprot:TRINITY_DN6586_c0_g1_i2.p1 TRINITY_DN6586_c0_g1~~TRINITY_DN6586_c0_g1_i2.p1  ORF type:complete len:290 (+),score=52.89 TRINITY_DN6586_c0_g1_i2:205-1074(+)